MAQLETIMTSQVSAKPVRDALPVDISAPRISKLTAFKQWPLLPICTHLSSSLSLLLLSPSSSLSPPHYPKPAEIPEKPKVNSWDNQPLPCIENKRISGPHLVRRTAAPVVKNTIPMFSGSDFDFDSILPIVAVLQPKGYFWILKN